MPPKVKIVIRAALSRFVGFHRVDSWETAQKKSMGYESPQVIDLVVNDAMRLREKIKESEQATSRFQQIATAMLLCISEGHGMEKKNWRVLDFGGGSGDYFFQFKKFAPGILMEWTVLETPALASELQLQNRNEDPNIKWIDSFEQLDGKYDVIVCSSVLQYLQNPFETLKELVKKSDFLILNRLPLIDSSEHIVAVQRIWSNKRRGSYPANFFSETRFLEELQGYGLIAMRWIVSEDQPVLGLRAFSNQGVVLSIRSDLFD